MKARKAASVAETPGQAGELSLGEEIGKQGTLNEKPVTSAKPGEQTPVIEKTTQPGQGKPEVKPSARGRYIGNKPVEPLRPPNKSRHVSENVKVGQSRVKGANTVLDPNVDYIADVKAINAGLATRDGDIFTVNNRRWLAKPDGSLTPIAGKGTINFTRGQYKAFRLYNTFGDCKRTRIQIEMSPDISEADAIMARETWNKWRRSSNE